MPSMHVGYALIVAAGLVHHGRRHVVRAIGALYPPFVVLLIVATGNRFFLDTAADALGVGLAAALAALLTQRPATTWLAALQSAAPEQIEYLNAHGTDTQLRRSPSGSVPTRRDCRSTAPPKRCSSSSRGASRSSGATRPACRPSSAKVTPPRRIPRPSRCCWRAPRAPPSPRW